MDQGTQQGLSAIVAKETWTVQDHAEMLRLLFSERDAARKFRQILADLEAKNPQPKGAAALMVGVARLMLSRYQDALAVLGDATDNADRRYFQALCYKGLRQYEKALENLDRARQESNAAQVDLEIVEIQALSGNLEAAGKLRAKIEAKSGATAQLFYLQGLIEELAGEHEKASAHYEQACSKDAGFGPALFRLAYYCDLHGEEERAIELYKQCLSHPPIYANSIMNLAVLYEDLGRYDEAAACLRRILAINPNHPRAKLFLKDVESSKTMFFDEDQAKRMAKRNAVLDIPVTDFELSVRARNCLKKMNIHTLGDLVRTTEAELLGYKNFGETSLKEIKDMLTSRNLRLGQAVEEETTTAAPAPAPEPQVSPETKGVLATPVGQIDFSIRARKAMEGLKIVTLGDLAAKSEGELLGCRNFGQTSLNEIRQRLAEYGLHLRESS